MFEANAVTDTENTMNPVDAGEDYSAGEQQPEETQQEVPEQNAEQPGVDGLPQGGDQKETGKAFSLERQRIEARERARYEQMLQTERQKMQSDPRYSAGDRLIGDIMRMRGVGVEEAAKIAEDGFIRALAEREGVSEYVARSMLGQMQAQQQPKQPQQMDANAQAAQVRQEIAQMELPKGFDFEQAVQDTGFIDLLTKFPTAAAVRIYAAEKQSAQAPQAFADQLRARQAIPQPMKPPQQAATPTRDYFAMSDEDFLKMDRQRQKGR